MIEFIKLREHRELASIAAKWFYQKWGIPIEAYAKSIEECINNKKISTAMVSCQER